MFGRRSAAFKKIIRYLSKQPATYQEIAKYSGYKSSGALSDYLANLEAAGFIQRHYNWDFATSKETRTNIYRLKDNYIRFYLKYIEPRSNLIKEGKYSDISITSLPAWNSIMGLQFENIVLNNRNLIIEALYIDPNEIISDNPYYQKMTSSSPGCQIDYLIQTKFNTIIVCEIKFSKNPIKKILLKK